jgi:aminopeptidase N
MKILLLSLAVLTAAVSWAQHGSFGVDSPFSAPNATLHYAPDRTYDLQNLVLTFDVDYPQREFKATAVNTVASLLNNVGKHFFHASKRIHIDSVLVDGKVAAYDRTDDGLWVHTPPFPQGVPFTVTFAYHSKKAEDGQGGWHWHEPTRGEPERVGFWTNGETQDTRDWAVTWDYPNDFTASETRTTVPAGWSVISNGALISDTPTPDRQRHTVVWRMTQPHATYLTSIVAGPFDIHKDSWSGIPLWYVCPKGMGDKLDYSFAHTKDILSFYSHKLGMKYPWPKYAQDVVFDFGGGQENVSATTYGVFLTDPREGRYDMDSIISHETAHQWFGDYLTCKDWGQIWLNESFATFMELSYMLESRGENEGLREVEQDSQAYFSESNRYKRPLATNFYSSPGVMFDAHTYPKGAVLLYSLRRQIGEEAFYAGLHRYLTTCGERPVESNDLCEAMTEGSGINLHPWFDQWIYKPGHPVIDWSWSWDDARKEVVVEVKQTQDTSKGAPIYDVPTHLGIFDGNRASRFVSIHLDKADQVFRVPNPAKPATVVFDPLHDFLREIPKPPWSAAELPAVFTADIDPVDRAYAMNQMLQGKPSEATLALIVDELRQEQGVYPPIVHTEALADPTREDLRGFWESELNHLNFERRTTAVNALAMLPKNAKDLALIRGMIDDKQPYAVVGAAILAVAKQDFANSKPLILHQAMTSPNPAVRFAGLRALAQAGAPESADALFAATSDSQPDAVRAEGLRALSYFKGADPRLLPALRNALASGSPILQGRAARVAALRKLKELIADIQALRKTSRFSDQMIDTWIAQINGQSSHGTFEP